MSPALFLILLCPVRTARAQCATIHDQDNHFVVEDCGDVLSKLSGQSTPDLLALLKDGSAPAAKVLGLERRPGAFEALSRALANSPDAELRLAAAAALGYLGDLRAVTPLLSAAQDADERVRAEAVDAGLAGLGRPALDALLRVAASSGPTEGRIAAMAAVSEIVDADKDAQDDDPRVLQAVSAFLNDDHCAPGFAAAVKTLRYERPPESIPVLEKALRRLEQAPRGSQRGRALYEALYQAMALHVTTLEHPLVREMLFERVFNYCQFKDRCRQDLSALLKDSQDR